MTNEQRAKLIEWLIEGNDAHDLAELFLDKCTSEDIDDLLRDMKENEQ